MLKVKIEFLAILELFGQDRRDFVFLKVFKKSSNFIGSYKNNFKIYLERL